MRPAAAIRSRLPAATDVTLTAGWIDVTGGNILIQGNGRNTTTITAASGDRRRFA